MEGRGRRWIAGAAVGLSIGHVACADALRASTPAISSGRARISLRFTGGLLAAVLAHPCPAAKRANVMRGRGVRNAPMRRFPITAGNRRTLSGQARTARTERQPRTAP